MRVVRSPEAASGWCPLPGTTQCSSLPLNAQRRFSLGNTIQPWKGVEDWEEVEEWVVVAATVAAVMVVAMAAVAAVMVMVMVVLVLAIMALAAAAVVVVVVVRRASPTSLRHNRIRHLLIRDQRWTAKLLL